MGSLLSTAKCEENHGGGQEQIRARGSGHGSEAEYSRGEIDHARLTELMQALRRIARLQRSATSARIEGRQKRREAANRRQDVWIRDANFMTEIQRLQAQGGFAGFDELLRLASQCQHSRDGLGQLEQEAIDTEQQWEGQIWKLREAETELYAEFEREFARAESYPSAAPSKQSSVVGSYSSLESQDEEVEKGQTAILQRTAESAASSTSSTFKIADGQTTIHLLGGAPKDQMLLGLGAFQASAQLDKVSMAHYDADSGIGDIDGPVSEWPTANPETFPQQLPPRRYPAIELFPQLLADFASRRERINNWLEDMILDSPLESVSLFKILQARLASEKKDMPSNWAQLVIAFWELDGAAVPRLGARSDRYSTEESSSVDIALSQAGLKNLHTRTRFHPPGTFQTLASSNPSVGTTRKVDGHFPNIMGPRSMKSGPPSPPRSNANSGSENTKTNAG